MKNNNYIKLRNLFILLYLYIISSIIFPASDNYGSTGDYGFKRLIPQLLFGLILGYSLSGLLGGFATKNKAIKSFYYFALFTLLNLFIYVIIKGQISLYFIAEEIKILAWIFPMYFLYKLFLFVNKKQVLIYVKIYIILFIVYVIIGSFQEYWFRSTGALEIMTEEQGVYTGAAIVFLAPLIFIAFEGRLKAYLFLIALGISLLTAKRAPIIMLSIFGLFQLHSMFKSLKKRDYIFIGIIVVLGFSLFLSSYWNMLVERNSNDLNRGDSYGSGRETFYLIVLKDFLNSNPFEIIFGHGFGSVQSLLLAKYGMAISSHNGFLDCIYVYGLVGIILYVIIFFQLFNKVIYISRYTNYKMVYIGFILMWFTQNMIIHGYNNPNMICFSIFLAYIFSEAHLNNIQIHFRKHQLNRIKKHKFN